MLPNWRDKDIKLKVRTMLTHRR